jgi:hypothetical protein
LIRFGAQVPGFLEPWRMAEKALTAMIQEACVQGISIRSVDYLVQAMGRSGIEDGNPRREYDFIAFEGGGARFFFRIDYYDQHMEGGSVDPSDPAKTTPVLTLTLASEY